MPSPMNSCISEMPGPAVEVMERAPAQPAPMRHAYGGQFVFGLDDREAGFAVLFDAVILHVVGQGFAQTGRRRDRIPGRDRDAGEHTAQRRGGIAVDDDFALCGIHLLRFDRARRLVEIFFGVLPSDFQRRLVQCNGLGFAFELFRQSDFHFRRIDVRAVRPTTPT